MKRVFYVLALLLVHCGAFAQPRAQLAATPPMGWNSWNWFGVKVTDQDVRQTADLIVSSGMRDAGYTYVNIDDSWEGERDDQGVLHANKRFPDMKSLADYVHSKGLKLGIYSSPGQHTCGGYAGSFGHEQQDADLYSSWGIDYLKYDLCSYRLETLALAPGDRLKQNALQRAAYEKMHIALLHTGRPIVFSICQEGHDSSWQWGTDVGGNLWRTTLDIQPTFDRIVRNGDAQANLAKYAGPGHWNDPDMLEVGNGKLSLDEDRTHMGWWAMLAAPLLAGNNLTKLTPDVTSILTNKEVIAIDQDPLGKEATRIYVEGPVEIWARPLSDGGRALLILNLGEDESFLRGITLHLKDSGAADGWQARDVWAHRDLGPIRDDYRFSLQRHSSLLLRLSARS